MDIRNFFSQNQSESIANFGVQIRGIILQNATEKIKQIIKSREKTQSLKIPAEFRVTNIILNLHFKNQQSIYKKKISDKIVNNELIKQSKQPSLKSTNLENEIKDLKHQLNQEKQNTSDLKLRHAKLDSELNAYKHENGDLVKNFKRLEFELRNREFQIQNYQDEIAYLNVKLNQFQADKKIFQENIIALEDQLVYEHERFNHLVTTKNEIEKILIETEKNLDIQQSNNINLTNIKLQLENDLKIAEKLKEENDTLSKRRDNDINTLINELEEERSNCQKANKNLKKLEENLIQVKNEINEKIGSNLNEEFQQNLYVTSLRIKNENLELLKKLDLKEKEINDQSLKNQIIFEKCQTLENTNNELLLIIKNNELNIHNLSNDLENEQTNNTDLLRANKLLQSRLNEVEKQRSQVFDEIERLCKEFEEKNKENAIEIKNFSEKFELKNKQYDNIKSELDRNKLEMSENISKMERLENDLKLKSEEIDAFIKSSQVVDNINNKIIELKAKLAEKEEKLVKKMSLDKDLVIELQNANKKLQDLELISEENSKLKSDIIRLENNLSLAKNEIKDLKQKLDQDNIELNKLIKKPNNTKIMGIRLADMNFNDKQNLKLEETIKKQETEIKNLTNKLDEEHTEFIRVKRRNQALQEELTEAEAEILRERSAKNKSERQRSELARKLEELDKELENSTYNQAILNDTRFRSENEINKLKQENENLAKKHETTFTQLKAVHEETVHEMSGRINQLIRAVNKLEKEKLQLESEYGPSSRASSSSGVSARATPARRF